MRAAAHIPDKRAAAAGVVYGAPPPRTLQILAERVGGVAMRRQREDEQQLRLAPDVSRRLSNLPARRRRRRQRAHRPLRCGCGCRWSVGGVSHCTLDKCNAMAAPAAGTLPDCIVARVRPPCACVRYGAAARAAPATQPTLERPAAAAHTICAHRRREVLASCCLFAEGNELAADGAAAPQATHLHETRHCRQCVSATAAPAAAAAPVLGPIDRRRQSRR